MVKMLGEKSWDDVRCNYPDSSSIEKLNFFLCIQKGILIYDILFLIYLQANSFISFVLKQIIFFSKMPKKCLVPESFKIHIQRAKIERQRRKHLANVELDDTLDNIIWNALDTMQMIK